MTVVPALSSVVATIRPLTFPLPSATKTPTRRKSCRGAVSRPEVALNGEKLVAGTRRKVYAPLRFFSEYLKSLAKALEDRRAKTLRTASRVGDFFIEGMSYDGLPSIRRRSIFGRPYDTKVLSS